MNTQGLGFAAFAFLLMVFLNRVLAVPQHARLNKELSQLKKRGPVCSVGLEKSITGARVAVLITDKTGRIMEVYRVKGKLITSAYVLEEDFPYRTCDEAKEAYEKKEKLSTQERAYLMAADYIVSGLSQREDS